DVELLVLVEIGFPWGRVDAVHRADLHARGVLLPDARLVDHVRHFKAPVRSGSRSRADNLSRTGVVFIVRVCKTSAQWTCRSRSHPTTCSPSPRARGSSAFFPSCAGRRARSSWP